MSAPRGTAGPCPTSATCPASPRKVRMAGRSKSSGKASGPPGVAASHPHPPGRPRLGPRPCRQRRLAEQPGRPRVGAVVRHLQPDAHPQGQALHLLRQVRRGVRPPLRVGQHLHRPQEPPPLLLLRGHAAAAGRLRHPLHHSRRPAAPQVRRRLQLRAACSAAARLCLVASPWGVAEPRRGTLCRARSAGASGAARRRWPWSRC